MLISDDNENLSYSFCAVTLKIPDPMVMLISHQQYEWELIGLLVIASWWEEEYRNFNFELKG